MSKKVKFDREKFKSLDQLDRIEYFLHRKDLNDSFSGSTTIHMIYLTFYMMSIFMVLGLLMYIGFESLVILKTLPQLTLIIKLALIVSVVIDILGVFLYLRRSKRLNDEFLKRGGFK